MTLKPASAADAERSPDGTTEAMSAARVDVSVVVPTYNRRDRLIRLLRALDVQQLTTATGRRFTLEVIVVSDGSTDGTRQAVAEFAAKADSSIRFEEQVNAGPAAARNRGIRAAAGAIVLFIDDDVVPEPQCVAVHVDHHDRQRDLVVIGPMLTPTDIELSPWVAWEQHQLEKQYEWFASRPEASHIHFYTGNASVERKALLAAGCFDPTFTRAEDIELAYRLACNGQSFIVDLAARAHHYAERSLGSWAGTARAYGHASVRFAASGRVEYWDRIRNDFSDMNPMLRGFTLALFPHRRTASIVSAVLVRTAVVSHGVGLGGPSRAMLSAVYALANTQGAADEMGSSSAFIGLVRRSEIPVQSLVALFLLEQTLGHVTHSKNLQSLIPHDGGVMPVFLPVDGTNGAPTWIPGASNWTVRAGLSARRALRQVRTTEIGRQAGVMFVHTQVPAVLLGRWMRRIPTVVSIDATPKQYDSLGEFYAHRVGSRFTESIKTRANVHCFGRARHIVAWSQWAKDGLVADYGIDPDRITVIPPGVDIDRWTRSTHDTEQGGPVRVLFVGGDLHRKGGDLLIEAARRLRSDADVPEFEVHLVTASSDVPAEAGVEVLRGLTSNSPELVSQFHRADIFCLPTLGDCLPMVLAEAAAAGLPLISTDVGAICEVVQNGRTGRLIRPGDLDGLVAALRTMLTSPDERRVLGRAARELAVAEHDARANAGRILDVLRDSVNSGAPRDR